MLAPSSVRFDPLPITYGKFICSRQALENQLLSVSLLICLGKRVSVKDTLRQWCYTKKCSWGLRFVKLSVHILSIVNDLKLILEKFLLRVNINISLNDLSEFSNEGDEDDKIASIDSNEVESNGLEKNCSSDLGIENGCDGSTLMEMTTVVTKIKVSVTNFQYNKAYHIMENQDSKKDDGVKWNDKVSDLVNFANGVAGLKMDYEEGFRSEMEYKL
ncbi:hypothetical protein Tco_0764465 [Tanacetum coccineum]